jgi:hypothetical protein
MKKIIIMISLIFILLFNVSAENNPGEKKASPIGSKQSMAIQIAVINSTKLVRIKNYAQLELFVLKGILVPVNRIDNVNVDCRLREDYCYALPFAADFLKDFGSDFFKQFGLWIMLNSAIRPMEDQTELCKINSNAISAWLSSHPTGAAVDVAYTDMSKEQIAWVIKYLNKLENDNVIEYTMERTQTVFHIMVFPWYGKYRLNKKQTP